MATLLDPASKNKKFLNMSLEEKRNLLLAAIREASSGGLITASTSVADLENDLQRTLQAAARYPI